MWQRLRFRPSPIPRAAQFSTCSAEAASLRAKSQERFRFPVPRYRSICGYCAAHTLFASIVKDVTAFTN
jgi:hypothetical protein